MRTPSLPLFKEETQQRKKGERLDEKPSPFPYSMQMGNRCRWEFEGTCLDQRDTPCSTRWRLVKWDMAWAWPTTTAHRA